MCSRAEAAPGPDVQLENRYQKFKALARPPAVQARALCSWASTSIVKMSLAMPPPIQSPFREEDSDSDASEDSAGLPQKLDHHKSRPNCSNLRLATCQWPLSDLIVGMKHLTPIQNPALPFPFHCQYTKREPNTSHDPQIKTDQMETLMKRLIGSTDILHWKSSCNSQIFPFTFTFDHIAITLKVSVQSCIIQNSTNNLN